MGEEFGLVRLRQRGRASTEGGIIGQSTETRKEEVEVDEVELEERLVGCWKTAFCGTKAGQHEAITNVSLGPRGNIRLEEARSS